MRLHLALIVTFFTAWSLPARAEPRMRGASAMDLAALALGSGGGSASALDKLRVEKAGDSIAFSALDVGIEAKIWDRLGIAIESLSASGVRAQQLLTSGDVDIGNGGLSWELMRELVAHLPVMVTPRWVRTNAQPVGIADVVRYLSAVLDLVEDA